MKNVIYTILVLVGLFMTFTESATTLHNIVGIAILLAVAIKTEVINIKDIINK